MASGGERGSRLIAMAIGVVAVFGLSLSAASFHLFRSVHRETARSHLDIHAREFARAVELAVRSRVGMLTHLRAHVERSLEDVDRADYQNVVAEFSSLFPSLRSVGWALRLPAGRAAAVEERMRSLGVADFRIRGLGAAASPAGDEILPILYVEPLAGNETLVGLDLFSVPDRREAAERARDSGGVAAIAPVALVAPPHRSGIVFLLPVYDTQDVPDNLPARRRAFRGVLGASFDAAELFSAVLRDLPQEVFAAAVTVPLGDRQEVLFGEPAPADAETIAVPLHIVERPWTLVLRPRLPAVSPSERALEWGVLLIGVLLTTILLVFLVATLGRTRKIEGLVNAVTTANDVLRREIHARGAAEEALKRLNSRLLDEMREREQAERALRRSEELFRRALAPTGVVVFSQDRDLRTTWVFNAPLGDDAVLGKTDREIMPAADADLLAELKRRVLATGLGQRETVHLEAGGGTDLDVTIEPLRDEAGALVGITGTAIDVTALTRARAEAERANAAKSRFLAAASHDLRQPLVAMRLFLELLAETLTTEEQRSYAARATGSLAATENLLSALMDVSALESGKIRPQFRPTELNGLIDQIANECQVEALEKGIVLRTRHCRHGDGTVRTDPVLLERIIRNLVSNALRYTLGGQVLIACRCRPASASIEVWDTGVGIPADKLERIFEDFYQIQHSHVGGGVGLGLGLSTVARMSKLLGYRIEVKSRVGRGSMFRIRMPTMPASVGGAAESRPADVAGDDLRGAVVAVVEDDITQLSPLVTTLERWGCRVIAGCGGDDIEAALMNSRLTPDVLITDYWLEEETGLEVVARLHRVLQRPVPTVVLTGDTGGDLAAAVHAAGHALIAKPYARTALRDAIVRALAAAASATSRRGHAEGGIPSSPYPGLATSNTFDRGGAWDGSGEC